MTETPAPAPAKKAAAKKVPAAKKAAPFKVKLVLIGKSRGHDHGDEVSVDQKRAARMVANGLARPKSS